jgi:hypothetical protein
MKNFDNYKRTRIASEDDREQPAASLSQALNQIDVIVLLCAERDSATIPAIGGVLASLFHLLCAACLLRPFQRLLPMYFRAPYLVIARSAVAILVRATQFSF